MHTWQLSNSLDAVIFDCDGTLSQVEGIDLLASMNGVEDAVRELTEQAMGATGLSAGLYAERLNLVRPTAEQIEAVGELYYAHLTPGVDEVIRILTSLQKAVYVISAGLAQPVRDFAARLGVPRERVFAVEVYFDEAGAYSGYDDQSPVTRQYGKGVVIDGIKKQAPRIMHIGDGMNDFEIADRVERFVGYGGSFYRERIESASPFYIKTPSLLSILPLSLTAEELALLDSSDTELYRQGLQDIEQARVKVQV